MVVNECGEVGGMNRNKRRDSAGTTVLFSAAFTIKDPP
jgi:hypothetical protein